MSITKLRKHGKSVVVTIPANEAKNLNLDVEYNVSTDEHGNISLIPKLENPFKHAKPGEYYEKDVWENMKPVGEEVW
ncbi:hypothetical protein GCM10008932_17440 [Alkalibacterium iburiense]|uniref:AbrB family transcriptional regulator n=1 Tax=Alkalibacterium iburiense TaxID=290589 RepID=A0ABN0XK33_9LACT